MEKISDLYPWIGHSELRNNSCLIRPIKAFKFVFSPIIAQGGNPKFVQSQLGHSSIRVTMDIYGHLMKEVNQEAEIKLGRSCSHANGFGFLCKWFRIFMQLRTQDAKNLSEIWANLAGQENRRKLA